MDRTESQRSDIGVAVQGPFVRMHVAVISIGEGRRGQWAACEAAWFMRDAANGTASECAPLNRPHPISELQSVLTLT